MPRTRQQLSTWHDPMSFSIEERVKMGLRNSSTSGVGKSGKPEPAKKRRPVLETSKKRKHEIEASKKQKSGLETATKRKTPLEGEREPLIGGKREPLIERKRQPRIEKRKSQPEKKRKPHFKLKREPQIAKRKSQHKTLGPCCEPDKVEMEKTESDQQVIIADSQQSSSNSESQVPSSNLIPGEGSVPSAGEQRIVNSTNNGIDCDDDSESCSGESGMSFYAIFLDTWQDMPCECDCNDEGNVVD